MVHLLDDFVDDSRYVPEDFIWRGPAEELLKIIRISDLDHVTISNAAIRGCPATYIRIWTRNHGMDMVGGQGPDGDTTIRTTILFIGDWVEINHRTSWEPAEYSYDDIELSDPDSLDILVGRLKCYGLVPESAILGDENDNKGGEERE